MAEIVPTPGAGDPPHEGEKHPNQVIAEKWFDAFNSQDIEALLSLYDDNARHYSPRLKERQPNTQGWIQGKDALRAWWQDAFTSLPTLHYTVISLIPNSVAVLMKYTRTVKGEPDTMVTEVLEIQDGKIVESRVL